MDDAPALAGTRPAHVAAWHDGSVDQRTDCLAEEVPVALVFNGITHAVMLASPMQLDDFARGFAWTEGFVAARDELRDIEVEPVDGGIELRLDVAPACEWRLRERRRTLAGRTGCGLCGTDSLAQVQRALPRVAPVSVATAALARGFESLRAQQAVQQRTGATHAAAWCALDGSVRIVREDVGRHNALDKLVGAMHQAGEDASHGFACITSRASFEMVQKAAAAGIAVLAAISAPTARAVHNAETLGIALAGFVRAGGGVAYTYPERFGLEPLR